MRLATAGSGAAHSRTSLREPAGRCEVHDKGAIVAGDERESGAKPCTCLGSRYAAVPPELRPRSRKASDLRKVTCPGCGLRYWTNRSADLCMDCERKGTQIPAEGSAPQAGAK
jgi:hypothetical protein